MSGPIRIFGVGALYATMLIDSAGAAVATPTPYLIGTLQSADCEIKQELKTLHGSGEFPVEVAKGKATISGKVSFGDAGVRVFELVTGLASQSGVLAVQNSTAQLTIPGTGDYTVVPPSSGTFLKNLGVVNAATGVPMTRVATAPATGEYTVNEATGNYDFNATQATAGLNVMIAFSYSATGAPARKLEVKQREMGVTPTFSLDIFQRTPRGGYQYVRLYQVVFDGVKMSSKNDDFTMPETSYQGFSDAAGRVYDVGSSS